MTLAELQQQLKEVERRVQEEEERSKVLQKREEAWRDQPKGWWEANIQELDLQELQELNAKYAELHTSLSNDLKRRSSGEAGSTSAEQSDPSPQKPINICEGF